MYVKYRCAVKHRSTLRYFPRLHQSPSSSGLIPIITNLRSNMEPTIVPILRNSEAIVIDYNLWGSYIAQDLLKNVSSSTYVLITDTNLYDLYVPSFERAFSHAVSIMNAESRLLIYTIPPGETSKSRRTKAEVEDWMLSEERDPPLDVSSVS